MKVGRIVLENDDYQQQNQMKNFDDDNSHEDYNESSRQMDFPS